MRNIPFICYVIIAILFNACESAEVVEVNLDGNEKVVIEGVLFSGKTFNGVKITRTLPINTTYNIKQAEIKDAYAYIIRNGVQIIPLHYTSDGMYKSFYEMDIIAGSTYEFYAYINNNQVYAKTIIPFAPLLLSAKYNNEGYFQAKVQAHTGEVYGAIWVVLSATTKKGNEFYSIDAPDDNNPAPVTTRTTIFDKDYLNSYYNNKRRIQVYAFDKQFAPYFSNSPKNLLAENNVLTGGTGVAWNVKGKNAIGMFIGVAEGGIEGEL